MDQRTIQILFALLRSAICGTKLTEEERNYYSPDLLQDLLLFYSSSEQKMVTLEEYVGRMKESQKYIYYACGETVDKIGLLPQTELLRDQGYEILYLTDDVDEFALKMLYSFQEKQFKSVSDKDLGLEDTAEQEETKKQNEEQGV